MTVEDIYYHIRFPKEESNFWKLNQELSYVDPFSEFSEVEGSSKIMMAIYMIYDPKSQAVNSGMDERQLKKDISKNYLLDENFDWSPYRKIITAYKSYSKTKVEKQLHSWWLQLKEREEYLQNELEWGEGAESDKLKDAMLRSTKSFYEEYHEIVSLLKEERQEKLMYGDYTPSLLEMWTIEEV